MVTVKVTQCPSELLAQLEAMSVRPREPRERRAQESLSSQRHSGEFLGPGFLDVVC